MFKNAVISSLRWSAAGRFSSQLVTWAITIIVIRLLNPSDYGTMALATMVVGIFAVFEELGLTAAIIQRKSVSEDMIQNIFGLTLVFSILLYGLVYLLAPLAASFFSVPDLQPVLRVLGLSVPVTAVGTIPLAMLQKEMKFKQKSIVEFVSAIAGSLATLGVALVRPDVWALISGMLVTSIVRTGGYWVAHGRLYAPGLDLNKIKREVQFGGLVTMDRLVWLFYSQADVFFVGKFLGNEVLGIYAVAMQLATLPLKKVVGILNQVGFAAFAKIRDDVSYVRSNLSLAVRSLSIVAFPLFFGITAVAGPAVSVFLGEKWLGVILPLQLLSLAIPFRMINSTTATLLFSMGEAGRALINSLIAVLVLVPAFMAASAMGNLVAVCSVWLIGYPVYYLICLHRSLPVIDMSMGDYLPPVLSFAALAGIMLLTVTAVSSFIQPLVRSDLAQLALLTMAGIAIYVGLLYALKRDELHDIVALVRG